MLVIKATRELDRDGTVEVEKGSRRAPDKQVVTLTLWTRHKVGDPNPNHVVRLELNKMEAETLANALKAATR